MCSAIIVFTSWTFKRQVIFSQIDKIINNLHHKNWFQIQYFHDEKLCSTLVTASKMSKTKKKKINRTYFLFSLWNKPTIMARHLPTINYLPYFISDPGQGIWNVNNSCLLSLHISFLVTSQGLHLLSASGSYKIKLWCYPEVFDKHVTGNLNEWWSRAIAELILWDREWSAACSLSKLLSSLTGLAQGILFYPAPSCNSRNILGFGMSSLRKEQTFLKVTVPILGSAQCALTLL